MKYFTFVLSIFYSFFCSAQDYKVVHISGNIYAEKVKRNLILGDQLKPEENISVEDDKVNCLLFNGKKKLAYNSLSSLKKGNVSEFFAMAPERQLIASRGAGDSAYIKLEDYFNNNKYLFISTDEEVLLDAKYINDLGNNKFLIVDSDKKKTLLHFENATLKLETSKLFSVGETEKEIEFYRVNTVSGEFIKETSLTILKMSEEELKNQIGLIDSTIDNEIENEERLRIIYDILCDIYGSLNYKKLTEFYNRTK